MFSRDTVAFLTGLSPGTVSGWVVRGVINPKVRGHRGGGHKGTTPHFFSCQQLLGLACCAAVQRSTGAVLGSAYVKQIMRPAERLSDQVLEDWLGPDHSGRQDEEKAMMKSCPWLAPNLEYDPETWDSIWAPTLLRALEAIKRFLANPERKPITRIDLVHQLVVTRPPAEKRVDL
jgi:hypothetical protein